MGLQAHSSRIDIAVITTKELEGFEIKSDADSLSRLPNQVAHYQNTFHKLTLVTTTKHIQKATELLPSTWGILLATATSNGAVKLTTVRRTQQNQKTQQIATAQLLWRDEALDELKKRGIGHGMSKLSRHYIWEKLARNLTPEDLRKTILERLIARENQNLWQHGSTEAQFHRNTPEARSA